MSFPVESVTSYRANLTNRKALNQRAPEKAFSKALEKADTKLTDIDISKLKFRNKKEVEDYIKEHVDLSNCTHKEYVKAARILYDNGMMSELEFSTTILDRSKLIDHLGADVVTNPIYRRFGEGYKNNWAEFFSEFANQQSKLGDFNTAKDLNRVSRLLKSLI